MRREYYWKVYKLQSICYERRNAGEGMLMKNNLQKKQKESRILRINITIKYSQNGTGLHDAYQFLVNKVIERRATACGRQSISG